MTKVRTFTSYVAETKTEYKYVIKFALNEMTDKVMDCLEKSLSKYELKSASAFRKTPIQESPLDFPNAKNTSVFICDLTLGYPASLDFLRTFISNNTGISSELVAVYSEHDPRQIETDLYLERSSPEYKAKYKAKLGTDYEDVDPEEKKYGAEYNMGFLQELEKVRKEREGTVVSVHDQALQKEDHSNLPGGYHEFNSEKNLRQNEVGFFGRVKRPNLTKIGETK
jgi:hypothetical protein